MFCRNCGNKLDDSDLFCTGCGNKVEPLPMLDAIEKNKIAFKGLLFDDHEPSFSNAVKVPEKQEQKPEQVAAPEAPAFVEPQAPAVQEEPEILSDLLEPELSEKPPVPDFSAVKSPLFSDDDDDLIAPSVNNPEIAVEETVEENEDAEIISDEAENVSPVEQEPAEEPAPAIKQDEFEEEKTVFIQEPDDPDKTVFLPRDESYDVYSGIIPGVNSQEFTYNTVNNAYPDRPVRATPPVENDVKPGADYNRPVFDERRYDVQQEYQPRGNAVPPYEYVPRSAPIPPQSRNPYDYNNYGESYPQQRAQETSTEEGKKSNAVLWVVIACIAVMIISIGAVGIVFITQLDETAVSDFFASFSDGKKDDNDDAEKADENNAEEDADFKSDNLPAAGAAKPCNSSCDDELFFEFDKSSGKISFV